MIGEAHPPQSELEFSLSFTLETNTNSDVITVIDINSDIQEPTKYNVVYFNDDKTSYEFVIYSLINVFGYGIEPATAMAVNVNDNGSGIVATMTQEMAEQKTSEVVSLARNNGFPLKVKAIPVE